jgi:hypothetical protein
MTDRHDSARTILSARQIGRRSFFYAWRFT